MVEPVYTHGQQRNCSVDLWLKQIKLRRSELLVDVYIRRMHGLSTDQQSSPQLF
jgi:hypothetical protein